MNLKWEQRESSVGRYVYIVDDIGPPWRALCYVRTTTPRAKEFVVMLCAKPEIWPEVERRLSPGKEVRAEAISEILRLAQGI